jgi:hypothetical protein
MDPVLVVGETGYLKNAVQGQWRFLKGDKEGDALSKSCGTQARLHFAKLY